MRHHLNTRLDRLTRRHHRTTRPATLTLRTTSADHHAGAAIGLGARLG